MKSDDLDNLRATICTNLPDFADGSHVAALGVYSMINFWDDLAGEEGRTLEALCMSEDQLKCLKSLNSSMLELSDSLDKDTQDVLKLRQNPIYREVEKISSEAHLKLQERARL